MKYIFFQRKPLITKKGDEYIENKDIPNQSFIDIGNILFQEGGIDLLENQIDNSITEINEIFENVDIPEQFFLDLGKTLLENPGDDLKV